MFRSIRLPAESKTEADFHYASFRANDERSFAISLESGGETCVGQELSGCLKRYESHGVLFDYPDFWEMAEQHEPDGDIIVTVSADGTCFWTLRILPSCPAPPDVVRSCVDAFREEYEDVEESPSSQTLAEMPAHTRELNFTCFELINTAVLSSVRTMEFTLLVWWQGTDHELAETRGILDHMTGSLRVISLI